jgi:hypothetical protein
MVIHFYNSSYFEREDGQIDGSQRPTRAKSMRPYLKTKSKKDWGCGSSDKVPV